MADEHFITLLILLQFSGMACIDGQFLNRLLSSIDSGIYFDFEEKFNQS